MVSIERCVRRCRGRVYEESPYFVIPKKGKKKKKERREEIEEAKCETAEPEEYGSGRERERRGQTFATSGGWVKMTRVKEKEGRKTVVALIGHHRH